jgi:hypothetical protein
MKKQWSAYRQECLERAKFKCEICGRTKGVTFQIHHPHYDSNLEPWEYPIEFCQVLCSGCHAREHAKILPDHGWALVHSDWENEESSGNASCELCGAAIQWHNILWHPQWGEITVGYDCADRLGSPEAHELRKRALRRRTFQNSPRWKYTSKGVLYKHGDIRIFIYDHGTYYTLNINGEWGKLRYGSVEEAKARAALKIHS